MSRRLAIMSRLPRVNPDDSDRYQEQANVRQGADDKARISLDPYHFQMAAVARQAALDLLRGRKSA